jgi:hypothetical protein
MIVSPIDEKHANPGGWSTGLNENEVRILPSQHAMIGRESI